MKSSKFFLAALMAPLVAAGCAQTPTSHQQGASARIQAQVSAKLTTPWTYDALQAPVPLPEYPRPQMTRAAWLNLNGKWNYMGGSAAPNAETPPTTAPAFPATPERILVPYPAESYLSGIGRQNERNLWYKRSFSVPAKWNGKRVLLNFGAVDRQTTVYVNGQKVGGHVGGYDAFSFDVTPYLRAGNNDLVVGVFDPTDDEGPRGKQVQNPGGIWYTATSGIWQTVWLEPTAAARITRLDLTPDVAGGRLRVVVRGENLSGQSVEAVASSGGVTVGTASGSVGTEFSIPIKDARLWSPSDPFLYDLKVRLRRGYAVVDEVGSYFGMRDIRMGAVGGVPRPLLNGKFVFQYGPLDQGFWPDGIYTAPTDEALKYDLQTLKDLGFNMVRKHIKVEPQRWFYWADKLGLMVWQDMPSTGSDGDPSSTARARFESESREIVNEHLSSPAVVTWVVFNEGWHDFDIPRVVSEFRSWDSTRLINAHTGFNVAGQSDTGVGDLVDIHAYPGPDAPSFTENRPAVLGEFGGNCLKVQGHMWNPFSGCPYTTYPDQDTLTRVYTDQVNSLRDLSVSRGLSGAVYTQTSDLEDELNGFLTYDRQVKKMDFARVKAANQALVSGVPFLRLGASYSLRTVTPGVTNRFLRQQDGLGFTEVVNSASPDALKKDASWKVVEGLADPACLSFESVSVPGSFLRHANSRLRIDPSDGSDLFKGDATFCLKAALDGSGGLSLESRNLAGRFIRHRNAEVWLDPFEDTAGFRADASWAQTSGWWRSSAALPLNEYRSLRVLTPGFDNRYIRHMNGLAYTEVVDGGSADTLKQDATWKIVAGLADASCYSFESRNFPGEYLRHSNSRVRREAGSGDLFRQDATFCAQSLSGGAVRFAAYNFPGRYLRHYAAEVWIADGLGSDWNSAGNLDADSRWAVESPWAP